MYDLTIVFLWMIIVLFANFDFMTCMKELIIKILSLVAVIYYRQMILRLSVSSLLVLLLLLLNIWHMNVASMFL